MKAHAELQRRHSANCDNPLKCRCRISMLAYDGVTRNKSGKLINRFISTGTGEWAEAEKFKAGWLAQFDPREAELRLLRAEKSKRERRIEDALALYLADMAKRLGPTHTVKIDRALFAHVTPDGQVTRAGSLFKWLAKQSPRPVFVSDLTEELLTAWRVSWKFADSTAVQRWGRVRQFFEFCRRMKWVDESPASGPSPTAAKGNRTTAFSDEQYGKVLKAAGEHTPPNLPPLTRENWQRRLTAILELMRWSGMDVGDAVQFRPESVDAQGVLRYRRTKTRKHNMECVIPLPARVAESLREIPPEKDTLAGQPFRTTASLGSDTATWARRITQLFGLAGITEVQTDIRRRRPHTKMLRDTFAVWHLRHGASLRTVSRMLGHSKTAMTEKYYLPYVPELDEAHIADARKALGNS